MQRIEEVKEILQTPKKITITTHRSPDGDAMGSSLGLYHVLVQLGHDVAVVVPNDYPKFLHWMPADDIVVEFESNQTKATELVDAADLIFCLDYNALHRMKDLGDVVGATSTVKIMIDHHPQPDDFATYMLSDVSASSTCQLVYEFFEKLELTHLVNAASASCLYSGIMTDTGSFRFPSTTAKTHSVVANLIEAGANGAEIYTKINDTNSVDRLKLLGYCLSEGMQVFPEFSTALITLSSAILDKYNYGPGDTEGVVNYGLSIEGINCAIIIKGHANENRMSFRSRGTFSVNDFARENFDGGGHLNAAGGTSRLSFNETVEKVKSLLPQYADKINNSY
jgi:phosphoesterase RecJ-like protein